MIRTRLAMAISIFATIGLLTGCYLLNRKQVSAGPEDVFAGSLPSDFEQTEAGRVLVWVFRREETTVDGYRIATPGHPRLLVIPERQP